MLLSVGNVNEAYLRGRQMINQFGVKSDSRNGAVLKFPFPVITAYKYPQERVLFDAQRDCNPFLHLFESIWMLGGRNDVEFLTTFTKQFQEYSDDGKTLHGAYGHRWKYHFAKDQLQRIIFELYSNPQSRRVVLSMWDPYIDPDVADLGGKDVPCNTHIYFNVRPNGELDMTVCCRSNDMIWGAYGANAVHMSFLHEYVARASGHPVGTYFQVSNDLHVYEKHFPLLESPDVAVGSVWADPYLDVCEAPLWTASESVKMFDRDVGTFLTSPFTAIPTDYYTRYFKDVVQPMAQIWRLHKAKLHESAIQKCEHVLSSDWRRAAKEWVQRRPPAPMKVSN